LEIVERSIGHIYDPAEVNPECWKFLKEQSLQVPPARTPLSDEWLGFSLR
jgi:hypothetical protein